MNLSSVKLVVSDMDGTLLNSKGEVSNRFFELFEALEKHNIHFVAASGRQYNSIIDKLQPIKDRITIIAENGGVAKQQEKVLVLNTLKADKIAPIIPLLRTIENTYTVLCGVDTAYIETTDKKFTALFDEYYTNYTIVDDLTKIIDDIDFLKIAVYHPISSEKYIYPALKQVENECLLKISGQHWLDISDAKANKGNAVRIVQKALNIPKEETLVFGDYHNDLEMLQEASFSFAMKNAHKDVKKIANFSTESNDDFGVERVLEKLLEDVERLH